MPHPNYTCRTDPCSDALSDPSHHSKLDVATHHRHRHPPPPPPPPPSIYSCLQSMSHCAVGKYEKTGPGGGMIREKKPRGTVASVKSAVRGAVADGVFTVPYRLDACAHISIVSYWLVHAIVSLHDLRVHHAMHPVIYVRQHKDYIFPATILRCRI
ncbi:unnamed protein product, partial [Iphiclides podalirius]